METKKCTKCGKDKALNCFYFRKDFKTPKYKSACTKCENIRKANYAKINPEKRKLACEKYVSNNPDKRYESCKSYEAVNKDRVRGWNRKNSKKGIDRLSDKYVKEQLKLRNIPVTPETISLKRKQLTIHRTIKKLENETN